MEFVQSIASSLSLLPVQVEAVLGLFEEGATIPFIARYRKDRTGGLDEVQIGKIQEESKFRAAFAERKAAIEKSIAEQGKMTDALQRSLNKALTLAELEDIYLPYKQKRKTRASVAREHGLEPLALLLMEQKATTDPQISAGEYLNENVLTVEDALQGASDILAEMINENADLRNGMRKIFEQQASLQCTVIPGKENEAAKYRDYFDFSEPIREMPSHRILAVLRGFIEGVLRVGITPLEDDALAHMERKIMVQHNPAAEQVKKSVRDAWKRLLQPSLETEFRTALKQRADEDAIQVFAGNLRQLLLGSPLGSKRMLAIDPGYRTGCKVVCLDEKGDLVENAVIYIHEPGKLASSESLIRHLADIHHTEVFAIGDGTAGRETEQFIKKLGLNLPVFLVNEDGASVYSASETAREEFPDQDVTVRGAVSIGRRLMDPLAELVKIDPKSIGVGQYQHDVNQFRLKEKLDHTVVSCVNLVGVNLNTASRHLLRYVSGINSGIAENIVKFRNEKGKFSSRKELLQVPRLGEKVFEQSAGFLRISSGVHPLDATGVHPESYGLVERMAADLGVPLQQLTGNEEMVNSIDPKKYIAGETGELTVRDILNELRKPGLDPRSTVQQFEFANIYAIEDVKPGYIVPGIVTNLTRFGAFVDIGVKQDGLVHVSEIAHEFIQDPSEKLKLNQHVQVKVMEVDIPRKRISLSIKQATDKPQSSEAGRQRDGKGALTANHTMRKDNAGNGKPSYAAQKKQADLSALPITDALAALKKKFGK